LRDETLRSGPQGALRAAGLPCAASAAFRSHGGDDLSDFQHRG